MYGRRRTVELLRNPNKNETLENKDYNVYY